MTTILPIQDVSYFRIIWQKYSNGSNALYIQYPSDTMKIEISAFLTKVNLESNDLIFAQEQGMDEFLEWPSTDNYNSVIIALVIMISIGIIANYLWSNRKGRRYSAG